MTKRPLAILLAAICVALLAPENLQAGGPSPRTSARMVYDNLTGQMVLFGGLTPPDASRRGLSLRETWEWTGSRWSQKFPEMSPPARHAQGMVYDSLRSRTVLFGGAQSGRTADTLFADTWAYSGGNWTNLNPPSSPSPRSYPGMAFDPRRDRVVLYGGVGDSGSVYDTWEFDGTTWTSVLASGPALRVPQLVYDEVRGEVLLIGVTDKTEVEMYRWNATAWEKISPTTLPSCPVQSTFVSAGGRVLLIGGDCTGSTQSSDLWVWDGTAWSKPGLDPVPSAVFGHTAAYDSLRREVILFGGIRFAISDATYRLLENVWTLVDTSLTPDARSRPVFETDPARGVIWLFGGQKANDTFRDLWKYSNGYWTRVAAAGEPQNCNSPVGTFDTDRSRLVITCETSAVYEWDGTAWFTFESLSTKPDPRRFTSMAYDPKTKRSVMFGGLGGFNYLKETWTWNGSAWTEVKPKNSPPRRMLSTLFYDPVQQKITMFGGIGRESVDDDIVRYGDMWSFDGTNWVQMKPAVLPPARYGAIAKLDQARNRIVMFGGKSALEEYLNEQWEWDGSTWSRVTVREEIVPRMNIGLAFDPSVQRLTLFGGYGGYYLSDLWTLGPTGWEHVSDARPRVRGVRRR